MRVTGSLALKSLTPVAVSPGVYNFPVRTVEVSGHLLGTLAWRKDNQGDTSSFRGTLSIIVPEDSEIIFLEPLYFEYQEKRWSIIDVKYQRPRVIFGLGGMYNG